ncbi:MAG: Uma2 family endonuclease [Myxococcales bacterium]|nr:Uma2 family endonuclease [Myxococcales bacterium]
MLFLLAMSGAVTRLATYEDLLGLPEDVRAEVLNGAIVTAPTPLLKHSNAQRALGRFIGGPFHDDDGRGGPGGWWIFVEVDVQLGVHNVVRPDLAGWRRERLPNPGEVRPIEAVPDWICEVLSPSTAARDRVVKRSLYAECGVPNYWLVDADARLLEAFVLQDGRWTLAGTYGEDASARIPPFEDVELEVGRLFLPKS